jgi:squalene-hopene/tetraprenyl-beta-curcumene cyclase
MDDRTPHSNLPPLGQPRSEGPSVESGRLGPLLLSRVDRAVASATAALFGLQTRDGEWCFELEADATIPAEYIMLEHYLDEIDEALEQDLARYLRRIQGSHGGWPLFHEGDLNISASVKAYYALKLAGDDIEAPHMRRAREAILAHGGAARANVFTRIALALFGQVPWRAVPVMPVEIMLLPKWFPFHLDKVAYWSRTVIAPLLVLMAKRPRARNPKRVDIAELFVTPPDRVRQYLVNPTGKWIGEAFLWLDRILRPIERHFPKLMRQRAIQRAIDFVVPRLNSDDGLGAIFPAMANSVMAFDALGYAKDHPHRAIAMTSVRKLLVKKPDESYCQPCLSPIWDTGLAWHALMEAGADGKDARFDKTVEWLLERQILDVRGDWISRRPDVRPGGWAFQYRNAHYPDVDDTAVVAMALARSGRAATDPRVQASLDRATEWLIGMQSKNGGWGAFDADNTHYYLNHIPFADHGALLDPPTEDVTARVLSYLAQIGYGASHPCVARAIDYLKREQQPDGSWFGRWGTNYIYGTWSVLCALNIVGEDMQAPYIRRAVAWLKSRQREDGGWGEDGATYWQERRAEMKESTPSQTAWAALALMATGDVEDEAVRRGVDYLLTSPREGARWTEPWYTAVGFPRVFYLRYHGYAAYFPLWALARYGNLMRANERRVNWGM